MIIPVVAQCFRALCERGMPEPCPPKAFFPGRCSVGGILCCGGEFARRSVGVNFHPTLSASKKPRYRCQRNLQSLDKSHNSRLLPVLLPVPRGPVDSIIMTRTKRQKLLARMKGVTRGDQRSKRKNIWGSFEFWYTGGKSRRRCCTVDVYESRI